MKLQELMETAAIQHEKTIASKLKRKGFEIWQSPAGSDNVFPDVGAAIDIGNIPVNLHIEAKLHKGATMGTVRNWTFDGNEFGATNYEKPNTALLVSMLNELPSAKKRAKKILKELKKFYSKQIKELSQRGVTAAIKDKNERNKQLQNYIDKKTTSMFIASQSSPEIGTMVVEHYLHKFKKRPGKNILMFVMGDEMFLVKTSGMPNKATMKKLFDILGVDDIPFLPETFPAEIEAYIQPTAKVEEGGRARIDTFLRVKSNYLNKIHGATLK